MSNDVIEHHPSHVIHESLYRPVLFAGVAPGLAMLEVSTVFALVFLVGLHVFTFMLVALYIVVLHPLAVWVTARDPHMPAMYLRTLGMRDYYVPHAAPFTITPPSRPSIPTAH
jgi:type IV secretory pathway TrbD component